MNIISLKYTNNKYEYDSWVTYLCARLRIQMPLLLFFLNIKNTNTPIMIPLKY